MRSKLVFQYDMKMVAIINSVGVDPEPQVNFECQNTMVISHHVIDISIVIIHIKGSGAICQTNSLRIVEDDA